MNRKNDEKDRNIIEEQAATIRLLTDLTKAGSWVVNYAPDGSLSSVQWGDGFRRLMGYSAQNDFPNVIESFTRGIYPEDRCPGNDKDHTFCNRAAELLCCQPDPCPAGQGLDFRRGRNDRFLFPAVVLYRLPVSVVHETF